MRTDRIVDLETEKRLAGLLPTTPMVMMQINLRYQRPGYDRAVKLEELTGVSRLVWMDKNFPNNEAVKEYARKLK